MEDEEAFAVSLWLQMAAIATLDSTTRQPGGSLPGKSPNVDRDFAGAHQRYMLRYFWPSNMLRPSTLYKGPQQSEEAFERRFRMPRTVFNRIFERTVHVSEYLRKGLRPNAVGKFGITPLLKVVCGMRMMAYGIPADLSDDLFDVSETTAFLCLFEFCEAVINCFETEYLREPTVEDLKRVERRFAEVGFPGCIGCVDCAGWFWKNCPKALQGAMIGKDGKPCLRMEVVCDLDLWIWSFQFGLPGVLNDLNILEVSDLFSKVLCGSFPPVCPSYTVNGQAFNWFYYLADGIYPDWKVFVKTLSQPTSNKAKHFCQRQEGVRKCVERVFGVLFRHFKVFLYRVSFGLRKNGGYCKSSSNNSQHGGGEKDGYVQ